MMGMEPMDTNLSAMEDAEWKHTRSIMTPAFTTGKLRKVSSAFGMIDYLYLFSHLIKEKGKKSSKYSSLF